MPGLTVFIMHYFCILVFKCLFVSCIFVMGHLLVQTLSALVSVKDFARFYSSYHTVSLTIKSFWTLHTVGRSGSFKVRVGVKTSLAC